MPNDNNSNVFEDLDQLEQLLTDTRASDTRTVSDKSDARDIIESFRGTDAGTPWTGLERNAVADRLLAIVEDPRSVKQGNLNLCGPAALICMWTARDPVGFANFATRLYDTGSSRIGSMSITPSAELLQQDFASLESASDTWGADWMVLSAIRNTTNAFWQGAWRGDPEQELAGLTRPEELVEWLQATGIYASVRNEANWISPAGIPHATAINLREGRDIAFLIHLNLIKAAKNRELDDDFLLSQFPNHYAVGLNQVSVDPQNGHVLLSLWTWGRSLDDYLNLSVPQEDFVHNYYGAVIADLD